MSEQALHLDNKQQPLGWFRVYLNAFGLFFLCNWLRVTLPEPIAYGIACAVYSAIMSFDTRNEPASTAWRWCWMSLFVGVAMTLFCLAVDALFGIYRLIKILSLK